MNLTIALDDDLVRRARSIAEAQGVSLNGLIRRYLESLAGPPTPEETVAELRRMWAESAGDSGGWKFNRDEIYEERLGRHRRDG
ncbi:DUF6364 family protein [Myxococcota bacterium]|nr:DUF6364 family protein [Myxococcota bacterium]